MVDMVVHRKELRGTLIRVLDLLGRRTRRRIVTLPVAEPEPVAAPVEAEPVEMAEAEPVAATPHRHSGEALEPAATVPTADRADPVLDRLNTFTPRSSISRWAASSRLLDALGSPQRTPAAGRPCRRHQRQGLDHRLPARHPGGGRASRVHVYTSPHLVRFHERIRLAGELIDDDAAGRNAGGVRAGERRASRSPIFEITTAAAFLAFARTPADCGPAGDRPGRASGRDQRDRASGGDRADAASPTITCSSWAAR